ncbi:MAG: twin-arginine translocase subunit TatC [Spirochaetia bacterium]
MTILREHPRPKGSSPGNDFYSSGGTTFWDHLEVLRKKILTALGITALAALVFFIFGDYFVQVLLKLPRDLGIELIYIKPQEKFVTYLRLAVYLSTIIGVPVLVIETFSFVVPALTAAEKRIMLPTAGIVVLLYLLGLLWSYFFLFPYVLGFFVGFGTPDVRAAWSIGAYIQLFGSVTVVCALLFLFPVVLVGGVKAGFYNIQQLARGRKHVLLGLFIVAALFTPPDPVTQLAVASILYCLYELSLLFIRISEQGNLKSKKRGKDG